MQRSWFRLIATSLGCAIPMALLGPTGAAHAAGMTLDPTLPAATVLATPTADGGASITLTTPAADSVCVWAVEWDIAGSDDHGSKAGLRPGGAPPSPGGRIPPQCGEGELPLTITLSANEVDAQADSVRVIWAPTANTSTFAPATVLAWPITAGQLLAAENAIATEEPDGSIMVEFTDPNPPGDVCVWRWELRRTGGSVFGSGTTERPLSSSAPCAVGVAIPADLDDPGNIDLVLWPEPNGNPVTGPSQALAYVDLPDVDLSAPVNTGATTTPPSLSLAWWTANGITASVPRAEVSAPPSVTGTCSYRVEWSASVIPSRGVWRTGDCAGTFIELPQLGLTAAQGWADAWMVKAAWAKGTIGAKPKKYSPFRMRTWLTGAELPDATTIQLTSDSTGPSWFIYGPASAACNAQVQLLSTTSPTTWSIVSDTFAAPLGLCDDLWAKHPIDTTGAAAIRVRVIPTTSTTPVGRWMYASLQRPEDPTDATVRWNDAGIPVVTFTDPNPAGTVCFWQVSAKSISVDDVTVNPDGSTSCSASTTFTMDADIDWSGIATLLIRSSSLAQSTAIEGWGPLVGAQVAYSPRLVTGKGTAPEATLTIDDAGYPVVVAAGKGCRFVAQWRFHGEQLWRTEPLPSSTACSDSVPLISAGTTSERLDVRVARATVDGDVITHGSWSTPTATIDPIPVPAVTFYPGTNRVRVDNQPSSLCGTWFEVQRDGTVFLASLVRGKEVSGALLCGPAATDSRMSTYVPAAGDQVRFAFIRGTAESGTLGPWTEWLAWPATDTSAPTATVIAPGTQQKTKGVVAFSVEATDDVGVDHIDVRVSGTIVATSSSPPEVGDIWTLTWDSSGFGSGSVIATVHVFDTAGNLTSVDRRFVLTNPSPVITVSGKAAKKAKAVQAKKVPAPTIPKAPVVDVPLKKPFAVAVPGKALIGAQVTIRAGFSWVVVGTVSSKGVLPALRINVSGQYRVRLNLANGKSRFVELRA